MSRSRSRATAAAITIATATALLAGCGGTDGTAQPGPDSSTTGVDGGGGDAADPCALVSDADLRTWTGQSFHVVAARSLSPAGHECRPVAPTDSPLALRWTVAPQQASLRAEAARVSSSSARPVATTLTGGGRSAPALVTRQDAADIRLVRVVTTSGEDVVVVEATQSGLTATAPSYQALDRAAESIATAYVARG